MTGFFSMGGLGDISVVSDAEKNALADVINAMTIGSTKRAMAAAHFNSGDFMGAAHVVIYGVVEPASLGELGSWLSSAWNASVKKVSAGIKRVEKSNLNDWITQGGPLGIADPKVGKVFEQYVGPALIAAAAAVGHPELSVALGTVFALAEKDRQVKAQKKAQSDYDSQQAAAQAAYDAQAAQEGAGPGASEAAPVYKYQQAQTTTAAIPWVLIAALGVGAYYLLTQKKGAK